MSQSKGIEGVFKSPIEGIAEEFQLKIYKDLVTDELTGLNLLDYNESYQLWASDKPNKHGRTGVIVKMRKYEGPDKG